MEDVDDQVRALNTAAALLIGCAGELIGHANQLMDDRLPQSEMGAEYFVHMASAISNELMDCDAQFPEDDGPPDSGGGEPMPILKVVNG